MGFHHSTVQYAIQSFSRLNSLRKLAVMQLINTSRFAASKMKIVVISFLLVCHSQASTVTANALAAWEKYVQQSKVELTRQSGNPDHFLPIHRQPAKIERARSGENPAVPSVQGEMVVVPSGLIHHWMGTVFVPNVRAFDALAVLQDYDSYAELYKPGVIHSKLLSHKPDEFSYRLKFVQKGFGIKTGLLGEFRTTYFQLNERTGYSVTEATQLVELQNPGSPDEKPLSTSASHGYVEKVFTIVRYQQSDRGVSVEVETLTLSRGVPASVRWLIAPIVERFSRQAMAGTMERLRDRTQAPRTFESASSR